jgi:exonuclease VII large subunit
MSLPVGNWLGGKSGEKKVVEFKDLPSQNVSPQPAKAAEILPPEVAPKHQTVGQVEVVNQTVSQQQIDEENREFQQQRKRRSKCCFFTICS